MTQPITPQEVGTGAFEHLPEEVIEIFNGFIEDKWNGKESFFTQDEVMEALEERFMLNREVLFDRRYLDVEGVYRNAGWKVQYESPSIGESFKAYFKFWK